jgi:hypothetical protein
LILCNISLYKPDGFPWEKKREMMGKDIPLKLLLEESLSQQRNAMMDNFAQIPQ